MWLAAVLGYVIGSLPFAFLLARHGAGVDLRVVGSGNVGATNVLRTSGLSLALAAMALDIAKGAAAVMIADRWQPAGPAAAAAGVGALVGHLYPIWLRFRGGKGVATACGAFAVLAPVATGVALCAFLILVWWSRYVSLGSLVAAALLGPAAYLTRASSDAVIAAVIAAALIIARHHSNIIRLAAGIERRLGEAAPAAYAQRDSLEPALSAKARDASRGGGAPRR